MKALGRFLLVMVGFCAAQGAINNNMFCPFSDDNKHNLSLIKWLSVPLRIQYHGFVESSKIDRYIFIVDGEIVYLHPGEIAKQQFILRQIFLNGRQVLIEDMLNNELYVLNSGEISYFPNKFECVLQDKISGQQLVFSDTNNIYKIQDRSISVVQKGPNLYVWESAKNQEPMLCVFPIIPSK